MTLKHPDLKTKSRLTPPHTQYNGISGPYKVCSLIPDQGRQHISRFVCTGNSSHDALYNMPVTIFASSSYVCFKLCHWLSAPYLWQLLPPANEVAGSSQVSVCPEGAGGLGRGGGLGIHPNGVDISRGIGTHPPPGVGTHPIPDTWTWEITGYNCKRSTFLFEICSARS